MTTQKEIAEQLNLSQATVSRALRNDKALPLETILKVKEFARENGHVSRRYSRGRSAAEITDVSPSLRLLALVGEGSDKVGNIGTIVIEILQGLIQASHKNNINLIVRNIGSMNDAKAVVAEFANNALGCIAILRFPLEIIQFLSANFNCLSVNHHYDGLDVKVIESDQEAAFCQMYLYLYEHGHRRIGFLTKVDSRMFVFRRYSGFLRGCHRSGVNTAPEWVLNIAAADRYEDDEAMADRVAELCRKSHVTAFLCSSGSLARSLIEKLEARNLQIPKALSIGGFDEVVIPLEDGRLLFGAQAGYERLTEIAIDVLRNFSLFNEIAVISTPAELHYGTTVADASAQM